jgi:hypothetical protein
MNIWYATAIAGSVLIIESLLKLALSQKSRRKIKGNVVELVSAVCVFLLALLALHFNLWGADIVVESNLWYTVASAGWVLFLEGFFSYLVNRLEGRESQGSFIRFFVGLGVFFVGFIVLFWGSSV